MLVIVAIFSLLIIAVGTYGVASPQGVIALAKRFASARGLAFGISIRVVFAVALWFGADASVTPFAFRVLAVVTLLGGFALLAMGAERLALYIDWWSRLSAVKLRLWLSGAFLFGLFTLTSSVLGLSGA